MEGTGSAALSQVIERVSKILVIVSGVALTFVPGAPGAITCKQES